MAKNIIVSFIWQLFWFSILFPILHLVIAGVRGVIPRIGHDERLFPRKLLSNNDALNKHRVKIADAILNNLTITKTSPSSVEIRVVASNRGNDFLYQTVLFIMEHQSKSNFSIRICNVESSEFPDLLRFSKLQIPISTIGEPKNRDTLNSTILKENEDYWKCLGLPSNSRYILLIEDDAVVIPEFSILLKSLVRRLDHHGYVDFVKLYHPNYLRKLPSWILVIIICVSQIPILFLQMGALSLPLSYLSCHLIKPFFKSFPIITFVVLSLALFWDLTRYGCQFAADFRFYLTGSAYFSYPESCCTPAVIFRETSVERMVEYFGKSVAYSGHAKDHILDESPFTGRQSDVNYVTHIGSFSSVRQRAVYLSDLTDAK